MTRFKDFLTEDLRKWVQQRWVDIGAPKKGGGYKPCGRSEGEKRKGYPKCVPAAKASGMSKKQKKSAVKRKRAAGNPGGKPTMVSTLKKTSKKSESMTRFKEALNELRGKYAAKRAKAYQDQHRGVRPVRGTPDQEDAAERATRDPQRPGKRGGYNDSVVAASQGLITTRGGEKVSADHVAKTFRKAGKHAVRKARKASGKPTYGRRPDGSRMSTGQGGRGDTRKKASRNESLEKFKTVILEKLCAKGKAAAKRKYDVYPSAYANMYGSAVCSGKVKPGGKKRKDENFTPEERASMAKMAPDEKKAYLAKKRDDAYTAQLQKTMDRQKNANLTHRASRQAKGEVGPQTRTVITNDNKNK